MSTSKLTRTIVLAGAMALLVGAVTSMTNTVFAAPPPGAGPPPEPPANPQVKDGSITCDSSCTATGDLVGAPKTSGPYTVTASGEVRTSSTVSKEVGPNDRVITPNGLQSESTSTVTGEGTFTDNTNDFSIPLETTSTSGEIKDAPNEHSGFEQDLSSTSTGDPTFTITR
jgi:hypothetical protein